MATMAAALRNFVQTAPRGVTRKEIREHIETHYPGQWTPGTLETQLYAAAVNNPKAYFHHKSSERFLFKADDGKFYLYSPELHGVNTWAPNADAPEDAFDTEDQADIEEMVEASITFERDVETHLVRNLDSIERGLRFVDRQVSIDVGRVDILAEDADGRRVVIELKVGQAKDSAVGQIARYLGWYSRKDGKPARGMLIASDFPAPVRYAAEAVRDLSLVTYKVQFAFEAVGVED